jgi:predicted RNA-binding protein with PUA-like domain
MNYWLIKSEPFKYSWEQFEKEGQTLWDGVRNYGARNNLRSMKIGELFGTTAMRAWKLLASLK